MTTAAPPSAESFVRRLLATEDADKRRGLIEHHGLLPEVVHEAVMRLVTEAEHIMGADPTRMERLCRDALALAGPGENEYVRAMARMRYGDALRLQSRNTEARDCYDLAAAAFTRLGHPVEAARTRIGWVWSTASLGGLADALAAARAARAVLAAHSDTVRVATLDETVGAIHLFHGQYPAALRCVTRALALFRTLGDGLRVGRCHANRGLVLTRLGRHREALAELEQARATYRDLGQDAGAARVTRSIGELEMDRGRYVVALRAFDEVRPVFRALRMHADALTVALTTAECYLHLNRPSDALTVLADAEGDLQRTESPQEALGMAVHRVAAHLLLDQRAAAIAVMDEAEHRHPTGALQYRAWLAAQRATVLLRDQAYEEALTTARRAHVLARASGMRRTVTDTLITQGAALHALGKLDEAGRAAARAARLARVEDAAPLLHRAHALLGAVAEGRGHGNVARRHYTAAIRQVEREQRGVIFEFRDSFAQNRGSAYERLAALELTNGRHMEALATAERAKSRALVDAIAGVVQLRPRGSGAIRRLARELATARAEYAAAFAHAPREWAETSAPSPLRARAEPSLGDLETRITGLVTRLQLIGAADDVADLYGAAPGVTVPPVPAGTALIEFFISGDDLLRFHVDAMGVRGDRLAGGVPEVERLLRLFRLNLDATETADPPRREHLAAQARALLTRLDARLLSGLTGLDGCDALVIVPHGLLHYLPFHALFDGERYLIERFAISYAPSAVLYGICRERAGRYARRRRQGALVLGHSAGGQLPFTVREAEAVGGVLGVSAYAEAAATRARLQADGRAAALIHIAAHGQFRSDAPLFSGIELADGPLTAVDIFDLELAASLVTLSGCETGRAALGGGDELVGLTRAFLYAGVACLLVSQWRVDDASTATLMTRFYRELSRGVGSAAALRTAQLAFLSPDLRERGWAHPFYWAGFQVIGDGQGLQARPARARKER